MPFLKIIKTIKSATILLLIGAILTPFGFNSAINLKGDFPKRANYYLSWDLSDETAADLAKWDLVILDMEHQNKNKAKIEKMRQLNPKIIILAYVAAQELRDDAIQLKQYAPLRARLAENIKDSWWLKDSSGGRISWWPGAHILNITADAPKVDGKNWGDFLSDFISLEILSSGVWDGIFFDNTWNSLTEKTGVNLDINGDGAVETSEAVENSYRAGMNAMIIRLRQNIGSNYILMGNDGETYTSLNGMLFENFPSARGWNRMMRDYTNFQTRSVAEPRFSMLNANTKNEGEANEYKKMRFGLGSALLGNGYYSFDFGDRDHGQTWWYDEYDIPLGVPTGNGYLIKNPKAEFNATGVWRRDYTAGVVLVNSGAFAETVNMDAEFEKIKGTQDIKINNGLIVSAITIPAQDAIVLLRPINQISGAFFKNGAFAKTLSGSGANLRNGFFTYDDKFKGGEWVYNDAAITIATERGAIKIFSDGKLTAEFTPFVKYTGELSLSLADIDKNGEKEIIAAKQTSGNEVKIFTLDGQLKKTFAALPFWHKTGISVTAADFNNDGNIEIATASPKNSSLIRIFSPTGKLLSGGFYAFGKSAKYGINLASGDINGDGKFEIIAGAATGKPEIRILNDKGKQMSAGFLAGSARVKTGVKVSSADIDLDGRWEIIALTGNVFGAVVK